MSKGHSVLEDEVKACIVKLDDAMAKIVLLEKQVAAMNESFSRGAIPRPQYEQQFRVMPSAFAVGNGS